MSKTSHRKATSVGSFKHNVFIMEGILFAALKEGATLNNGRYVIIRRLGEPSGFGITYEALDTKFECTRAIKEFFYDRHSFRDADTKTVRSYNISPGDYAVHRNDLVREAKRLNGLSHPNVVRVLEHFDENDTSYMVMEYIKGESLESIVKNMGKLSYDLAVNYIAQIVEAVEYLHSRKEPILHRDIKPANIMITPDDRAILIDFGTAREFIQDKTDNFTKGFASECYSPLEQLHPRISRTGSYTDIYSIGATLYYILTGQRPTDADERQGGVELPEPKSLNPDLSDAANVTILTAMALKPQNRYQRTSDLWEDLLGNSEVYKELEPQPIPPPHNYKKALYAMGGVILLAGGMFLWQGSKISEYNRLKTLADKSYNEREFASAINEYNGAKRVLPIFKSSKLIDEQILKSKNEIQKMLPEMVIVQGGSFTMGATSEQGTDYTNAELPGHNVTLDGFQIGKYEVTQKQWEAVMSSNPSENKGGDLPVENVSWDLAQRYIQQLNRKTGENFRLPTEAEWEYASRGGRSGHYKYSGSNNVSDVAWHIGNAGNNTMKVGSKKPNQLGIYDMSGNVFEWCQDWVSSNYGNAGTLNPKGPSSGEFRIIRGGCFDMAQGYCRVSFRNGYEPSDKAPQIGFRLAHN